jgi:hypothetical protein
VTLTTDLFLDDWNIMAVPKTTIVELARLASGNAVIPTRVVYAKDGVEVIVEKREDGEAVIEVRDDGNIVFRSPFKRINWEGVLCVYKGLEDARIEAMSIPASSESYW